MKSIMLLSIIAFAFSAQAGVIKNKKTGDSIQIELAEGSKKVVIVTDIEGKAKRAEMPIKDYNFKARTLNYNFAQGGPFDGPFSGTTTLMESSNVPGELKVVMAIPSAAMDVIFLPITIPVSLFSQSSPAKFRSDMKMVESLLADPTFEVEVSNMKFKRIVKIAEGFIK